MLWDMVILSSRVSFLPQLVSSFHLNQDIVFLWLCPDPVHSKEIFLHCWMSYRLLGFTTPPCPSFIPFLILTWLTPTFSPHIVYPFLGEAHSTRSLSGSWAFQHQHLFPGFLRLPPELPFKHSKVLSGGCSGFPISASGSRSIRQHFEPQ